MGTLFLCLVGCFSMIILTPAVLSVLYAGVLHFCICTCSVQLSMFHMERRSRNMLLIIMIKEEVHHWPPAVTQFWNWAGPAPAAHSPAASAGAHWDPSAACSAGVFLGSAHTQGGTMWCCSILHVLREVKKKTTYGLAWWCQVWWLWILNRNKELFSLSLTHTHTHIYKHTHTNTHTHTHTHYAHIQLKNWFLSNQVLPICFLSVNALV